MTNNYTDNNQRIPILHSDDEPALLMFLLQNLEHQTQGIFELDKDGDNKLHHEELLARPKNGNIQNWVEQLESADNAHVLDKANLIMVDDMLDNLKNPIALNVSGQSFSDPEFRSVLSNFANRCHEQFKNSQPMIAIEITESAEIADLSVVRESMEHLQDCGIKVYADDFGASSGYMNEDIIMSLPFDSVKLDRDLVRNLEQPEVYERTMDMINYAKDKDISIVAEWVEDETVLSKLKDMGVTYGQGYHLAKPQNLELINPEVVRDRARNRNDSLEM